MNRKLTLGLLAALFFGPVIVAWIWFFHFSDNGSEPIDTVNKGELITPVVAMADVELRSRESGEMEQVFGEDWSIVILAPQACDASCQQALYVTRQVWRRLNRDMDRVQRVFVAGPDVEIDRSEHPLLRIFETGSEVERMFIEAVPTHSPARRVFLADPMGNLMMSYPIELEPEMLHDDLKRLLKISQAG